MSFNPLSPRTFPQDPSTTGMHTRKSRPMFVNLKNRLHLPGVNELLAPCTRHLTANQYKRMLSAWQGMDRYQIFGFVHYGRAIGILALEMQGDDQARVLALAMQPQSQRRGMGRRMVVEGFCTLDLNLLRAQASEDLIDFYRSLHFQIHATGQSPSGATIYSCFLSREALYAAYEHEYSAGAVLFSQTKAGRMYVLVTELSGNTGLPKGHVEAGENNQQAALREIFEETGVHADILPGFGGEIVYPQGRGMLKHFTYFLASFGQDQRAVSGMDVVVHVLPYDQALRKLSFADVRIILREAEEFLNAREGLSPNEADAE